MMDENKKGLKIKFCIILLIAFITTILILIFLNVKYDKNAINDNEDSSSTMEKVDNILVLFIDDGEILEKLEVNKGKTISEPLTPIKENYVFVEWQLNGEKYDFTKPVITDMTLNAVWKELPKEIEVYKVIFNSNGGTAISNQIIEAGNSVIKPSNPIKEGYEFIEWRLNGKKYDFMKPVISDITLNAIWKKNTYIVTFNSSGGTNIDPQQIENGNKVMKPSDPKKEGYEFVEWQLNGITYDFTKPVTSNITLNAIWNKNKYIVTFNSDGGTKINSQQIENGNKIIKPSNPTKEGYEFVEWQLNGITYDFTKPVTSNMTLTAIWNKIPNKYTVIFNSNGGSTISNQNVNEGNKMIKPSNPTKEGYEFVEWQLNGITYDFTKPVTSNMTLNAIWKKNIYTVNFNSDGGTKIASQQIEIGNKVTKPSDPTKDGYEFIEWQLNGAVYNFDLPVTSNITLTSKWKKTTFNVGDEVSIGGEKFYVVNPYPSSNHVDLLAKHTLGPNYRQSSVNNPVQFSNSNGWTYGDKSINIPAGPVRTYLDEYLVYLNGITNNRVLSVTIMTKNTLINLGFDSFITEFCGQNTNIIHNGQSYWLRTGDDGSSYKVLFIHGQRCAAGSDSYESKYGVRPLVTISKDAL